METARQMDDKEALEAALKDLSPRDRELVKNVLEDHP